MPGEVRAGISAARHDAGCGVRPNSVAGAAKRDADGPARRFELGELGVMTGPPPIHLLRTATGHDRVTRSSRQSPSRGAACGCWIRAWSHASPLFKEPAA